MVNIKWTNEAVDCLKEIHGYIAEDNRQIAKRIIQERYMKKFRYSLPFRKLDIVIQI